MKRQISNEQSPIASIVFIVIGLTIATLITLIFIKEYSQVGKTLSVLLMLSFAFIGWYYSIRFYNVSFDSNFLYITRFGRTKQIDLKNVTDLKPSYFPIHIFYSSCYIVTISYLDIEMKKNIRFISKGSIGLRRSVKDIPYLDILRQFVLDKKYGR